MKTCILKFSNKIFHPIFFLDSEGNTNFMNETGSRFLKHINEEKIETIINTKDLIEECGYIEKDKVYTKTITLDRLKLDIEIYVLKVNYIEGISHIIYFGESIYTSGAVKDILNSIDNVITIYDKYGNLLNYNNAAEIMAYKEFKLNIENFIGTNSNYIVESGLSKETVVGNVIELKEKVVKNIEFANGKVMTYTGLPIFDEEGDVKNVMVTGRDVEKLVEIRNKLFNLKKEKSLINISYESTGEEHPLVYSSKEMKKVMQIAKRVSKTESPVFITGSSGVGKEEIARYIYAHSDRYKKTFIAMNCAAIPSDLLEMELFGYEEGSFTGAKKGGKKGLLEKANGGTVFLDEIGELPMDMQSKLLRVIQENKFIKTGGTEYIEVDIRYISATNLSQKDLMDNSKFRQDLYYRLSIVPIHILDLKDRKEDIIPLTLYFIDQFNQKYNRKTQIKDSVLEIFKQYEWPGNVRELKNVIERIMILGDGEEIKSGDFYDAINLDFGHEKGLKENDLNLQIKEEMTLEEAHLMLDKLLIENSMKKYKDVKKVSQVLGVNKSTIYRKLEKIKDNTE